MPNKLNHYEAMTFQVYNYDDFNRIQELYWEGWREYMRQIVGGKTIYYLYREPEMDMSPKPEEFLSNYE